MLAFTSCWHLSLLLFTPLVKRLAFRVGAVDAPNYRKVHAHIMPRLGGLAIIWCIFNCFLLYRPEGQYE